MEQAPTGFNPSLIIGVQASRVAERILATCNGVYENTAGVRISRSQPISSSLAGLKAIVTGGLRGICAGAGRALVAQDADVAVIVRSSTALATSLTTDLDAYGGDGFAVTVDISDEADV